MADIESALYSILSTTGAITTICGTRIYPIKMPDNSIFPAVTYQKIVETTEHIINSSGQLKKAIFSISTWVRHTPTATPATARELSAAIRAAIDGIRGLYSGMDIQGILIQNETQTYDEDVEVYRILQDFLIIYRI